MNEFSRLFAKSGLSLERLSTFLEVVDAGSITAAAGGESTRQSQYSRQVKELEIYFGLALVRRVGRTIRVTDDGHRLAAMIRQQFLDLDGFRESAAGRQVALRIGASGSIIEWMLTPRLGGCRDVLRGATLDLVQSRSAEVVRGVADGRLDFGIVRQDAIPERTESRPLGSVGYSLFMPSSLIAKRSRAGVGRLLATLPVATLLPGGRFQTALDEWLVEEGICPEIVSRVSSFLAAASIVGAGQAAAVLPDLAASRFQDHAVVRKPLPWDYLRDLALLWNNRGLDRAVLGEREIDGLAKVLRGKTEAG